MQSVNIQQLVLSAILLLQSQVFCSPTPLPAAARSEKRSFLSRLWGDKKKPEEKEDMGQAMRMMTYDRAANEKAAVPMLSMGAHALKWFRLDDGVMGGQSQSNMDSDLAVSSPSDALHFKGTINTSGGGFASLRAKIPPGSLNEKVSGVRLRFRGDGKTYKFLLSDGARGTGSPMSRTPSWQIDVPTKVPENDEAWQEVVLPFDRLVASFGGRPQSRPSQKEGNQYKFDPKSVGEVGIMLSLMLSDGKPNPKETFGEGIFPFSFQLKSIEPVADDVCAKE